VQRQQIRIAVTDLEAGMYVAQLDRPWIETPFPLQGFVIRSYRDVQNLLPYCKHVYIDVERGKPPRPQELRGAPAPAGASMDRPLRAQIGRYPRTTPMARELRTAARSRRRLLASLDALSRDAGGASAEALAATRKASATLVGSVIRNPDAMVWLARIQQHAGSVFEHGVRACTWAVVLGRHLGMSSSALESLALGTVLADVGVLRLPPGTREEEPGVEGAAAAGWRQHVQHGLDLLHDSPDVDELALGVVAAHHERHDGRGYPRGLRGDAIPYLARVAGLAQAYDRLLNPRDGADALTTAEALASLYRQRGEAFQQALVDEFIQAIGPYPPGTLVILSNGVAGVVLEQTREHRLRPSVLQLTDREGHLRRRLRVVNLAGAQQDRALHVERAADPAELGIDLGRIHRVWFERRVARGISFAA